MTENRDNEAIKILTALPALFFIGWASVVLFVQLSYWFDSGDWVAVPATVAFYHDDSYPPRIAKWLPPSDTESGIGKWLANPQAALGPHKVVAAVLQGVSFPITLFLLGLAYVLVLEGLINYVDTVVRRWKTGKEEKK